MLIHHWQVNMLTLLELVEAAGVQLLLHMQEIVMELRREAIVTEAAA